MGTDMLRNVMYDVIQIGKVEYGFWYIYWITLKNSRRAIHFYEKNGFKKADDYNLKRIQSIVGDSEE